MNLRLTTAALFSLILASPLAWADTVVYPTGVHPADFQAVQAAVDGGGRVLLKAVNAAGQPTAFDFGPAAAGGGTVQLHTDVEVRGETGPGRATVIRGGFAPFRVQVPVRVDIKRIHFEGPRGAAVFLFASTGGEITDNVITGVVGMPWSEFGRKAMGVWVLGEEAGGYGPVTGTLTIARNRISDMQAEDGIGLAIVGFRGEVRVLGNDIRGTNFMGILAFAHAGSVFIQDNDVVPGPERFPGFYSVGQGIQVGPLFAGMFEAPPGPAVIRDNRVLCENPNADGIVLFGVDEPLDRGAVVGNRVEMRDSLFGGISLLDNVSHTLVALNRVRGRAAFALDVVNYYDVPSRGNVFLANSTAGLAPSVATVFLDRFADDTWVVPCQGTVVDLGAGNHTPGCEAAPALRQGADGARPVPRWLGAPEFTSPAGQAVER
jgi:hypothetical protein